MAANSLLYLLLTAGLTTPPDQSVTTESPLAIDTEYTTELTYGPTEDEIELHRTTKWPGYGRPQYTTGWRQDSQYTIRWRQAPQYTTEDPNYQYTVSPVTEMENEDWTYGYQTRKPSKQPEVNAYRSDLWPFNTKELKHEVATEVDQQEHKTFRHGYEPFDTKESQHEVDSFTLETEEPESEMELPEPWLHKKGKRKCPPREHFSKCHKNCEMTCSNHMKPKPCPRSCQKGCVCDGGLVRNQEGKCVARDQCPTLEIGSEAQATESWNQEPFTRKYNDESCPVGETWSDCDAGCEETCETLGRPQICPRMCVPGCVCAEPGTVRGPDHKCVYPPLCQYAEDQNEPSRANIYWPAEEDSDNPRAVPDEPVQSEEDTDIQRENLMAEDDDSHGCSNKFYEFMCEVGCRARGHKFGICNGISCNCLDK